MKIDPNVLKGEPGDSDYSSDSDSDGEEFAAQNNPYKHSEQIEDNKE